MLAPIVFLQFFCNFNRTSNISSVPLLYFDFKIFHLNIVYCSVIIISNAGFLFVCVLGRRLISGYLVLFICQQTIVCFSQNHCNICTLLYRCFKRINQFYSLCQIPGILKIFSRASYYC